MAITTGSLTRTKEKGKCRAIGAFSILDSSGLIDRTRSVRRERAPWANAMLFELFDERLGDYLMKSDAEWLNQFCEARRAASLRI